MRKTLLRSRKRRGERPAQSHGSRRDGEKSAYTDDEFQRGVWLIAMVLFVLLLVGGGLIFSG